MTSVYSAYQRKRDAYGTVSGNLRVLAATSGLVSLVPARPGTTIFVQKIHVQVTAGAGGALWTLQDGAGVLVVPNVSAGAIGHVDFDFGPRGVAATEATGLDLNVVAGASGWITYEGYRQLTRGGAATPGPAAYADLVITDRALAYWRLNDAEGYAQAVLSDAPVGYWRMDAPSGTTEIDRSSGGHNGTYAGVYTLNQPGALASGDAAVALNVASVDVGNVAALAFTGAFSVEAYLKWTGSGVYFCVTKNLAAGNGWTLNAQNGGLGFWAYTVAGAPVFNVSTVAFYNDGLFHHVVGTWDGTANAGGVGLYVDGVRIITSAAVAGTPGQPAVPCFIGRQGDTTGGSFVGTIDEVAVYNYALSAQQIANHYALRTSPITTVAPAIAVDSIGGKNGTITGGVTLNQPGALASGDAAMIFDGTTGAIDCPTLVIPIAFTVEAWIRTPAGAVQKLILSQRPYVATGWVIIAIDNGAPGWLTMYIDGSTQIWSSHALIPDVWHHVVLVNTGTLTTMYIDGVLDGSAAQVHASATTGGRFGYDSIAGSRWLGSLDEVAIYPYALSASQVLAHFQAASRT